MDDDQRSITVDMQQCAHYIVVGVVVVVGIVVAVADCRRSVVAVAVAAGRCLLVLKLKFPF